MSCECAYLFKYRQAIYIRTRKRITLLLLLAASCELLTCTGRRPRLIVRLIVYTSEDDNARELSIIDHRAASAFWWTAIAVYYYCNYRDSRVAGRHETVPKRMPYFFSRRMPWTKGRRYFFDSFFFFRFSRESAGRRISTSPITPSATPRLIVNIDWRRFILLWCAQKKKKKLPRRVGILACAYGN